VFVGALLLAERAPPKEVRKVLRDQRGTRQQEFCTTSFHSEIHNRSHYARDEAASIPLSSSFGYGFYYVGNRPTTLTSPFQLACS
jgi:hypothetical protein